MQKSYKFNPEDYKGIMNMYEDMTLCYELYEKYMTEKTKQSRFEFEKHSQDYFFTIKHREKEGAITKAVAEELRGYLRELIND